MITIRTERAEDRTFITSINDQAFGQKDEGQLVTLIRNSPEFISELSLVADKDSTIIGHILFSRMYIDIVDEMGETGQVDNVIPATAAPRKFPLPVLSLAPMSVLPEYQGQGIGKELVTQGLESCRTLDFPVVVVIGHPWFYPKLGFIQARPMSLEAPFEVPDEAFMVWEAETGVIQRALNGGNGMIRFASTFDEIMKEKNIT